MARTRRGERAESWDRGGWTDPWADSAGAGLDDLALDDEAFARAIAEGRRVEHAA